MSRIESSIESSAAEKYASDDLGLFSAIRDQDIPAIRGLIRFCGHDVNSQIEGGSYRAYQYYLTPTPLSFAISLENPQVVKTLLELGANKQNSFAIEAAKQSICNEIRRLFDLPTIIHVEETIDSNDYMDHKSKEMGVKLVKAFHDKQRPDVIKELVLAGAPVNYRLDYGLPVVCESEFVAQFSLLFSDDDDEKNLFSNAKRIFADKEAKELVSYIKTGLTIFEILHSQSANTKIVPVAKKFKDFILYNAAECRFNPDHQNGALIISAGLMDPNFLRQVLTAGKSRSNIKPEKNGAHVNFLGYFGDNAAVWSTILLDILSLRILLNNGSSFENIGVTGSSLLHWVAVAARLDSTQTRQKKVEAIAHLLLAKGARPDVANKLRKTALDYARGNLCELFKKYCSEQKLVLSPSVTLNSGSGEPERPDHALPGSPQSQTVALQQLGLMPKPQEKPKENCTQKTVRVISSYCTIS